MTEQLEAREEACALEADGRKLLVSEVNDLNSRLRELEALARADMDRNIDDPVKLKILIGYLLRIFDNQFVDVIKSLVSFCLEL